jgi:uncharacterized protein (TIGR03435 family)
LTGAAAAAQPVGPTLEVASVRKHVPTAPRDGVRSGVTLSGSRVTVEGLSLNLLIMEAYNLKAYQIAAGPDWMGGGSMSDVAAKAASIEEYDVSAKAEGEAALTRDQARLILQAVLADRFHLRVHRETKEIPVYALVVGKYGLKLKESAPDAKSGPTVEITPSGMRFSDSKGTITQLAGLLSRSADRPVLDNSGLMGFYSITLEWSIDDARLASALDIPRERDPAGPSLFTAVQEQLGLKLDPTKAPMDVLVIDHVEKPSEN